VSTESDGNSNMGSTQEAIDVFEAARQSGKAVAGRKQPLWVRHHSSIPYATDFPAQYAPGKAANRTCCCPRRACGALTPIIVGGVAVSDESMIDSQ
jgi:hypothetical protein